MCSNYTLLNLLGCGTELALYPSMDAKGDIAQVILVEGTHEYEVNGSLIRADLHINGARVWIVSPTVN